MKRALSVTCCCNDFGEIVVRGRYGQEKVARDRKVAAQQVRIEGEQNLRREPVTLGQGIDPLRLSDPDKAYRATGVGWGGTKSSLLIALGPKEREKLGIVVPASETQSCRHAA